jgi:hypothetical protein
MAQVQEAPSSSSSSFKYEIMLYKQWDDAKGKGRGCRHQILLSILALLRTIAQKLKLPQGKLHTCGCLFWEPVTCIRFQTELRIGKATLTATCRTMCTAPNDLAAGAMLEPAACKQGPQTLNCGQSLRTRKTNWETG